MAKHSKKYHFRHGVTIPHFPELGDSQECWLSSTPKGKSVYVQKTYNFCPVLLNSNSSLGYEKRTGGGVVSAVQTQICVEAGAYHLTIGGSPVSSKIAIERRTLS